jgi:hypothetical protein
MTCKEYVLEIAPDALCMEYDDWRGKHWWWISIYCPFPYRTSLASSHTNEKLTWKYAKRELKKKMAKEFLGKLES